jgi:two-component system, OmpR family, alkaline phosphatase synthesis response regulator PhoP
MKRKILLVEDEKGIALALRHTLNGAGYDVWPAEDGMAGLEIALSKRPDLILLDLVLPKLNGFLVLEGLKQNEGTKTIPVFVISAKAEETDIRKARKLGAAEYLVKPFRSAELLTLISQYINKEG